MAEDTGTDGPIVKLAIGLKLGENPVDMICDYKENEALVFVGEMNDMKLNTKDFFPGLDLGFSCKSGKAAYIHTTGVANPNADELKKLKIFPNDSGLPTQIAAIISPEPEKNSGRNLFYLDFETAELEAFGKSLDIPYFRMLYASKSQPKPTDKQD